MVLDSDGQLWVWGYDGCATGDVPAQHDAWQLRLIEGQLKGKQVVAFDVGGCHCYLYPAACWLCSL